MRPYSTEQRPARGPTFRKTAFVVCMAIVGNIFGPHTPLSLLAACCALIFVGIYLGSNLTY